jgi:uncharacterized protein DUF4124/YXWGXW repeat-containing protein
LICICRIASGFDEIWPIGIVDAVYENQGCPSYIVSMRTHETLGRGTMSATHLSCWIFRGFLWLTAAAGMAQAGEIYKSVDANGNVVYSDHLDPSMSHSTAVQLEDPILPPSLHFCWTNCFSLILDNGVYRRTDGTDESWTVETFSANAIVLHRHDAPADWNGHSQDVVYAGQVANDRLIGVTVNGKPTSGIDASWGTALNTLPGSNAERDAKITANPDSSSGNTVSSAATPPPLPEEEQPALPEDGDLWTPGYWYWRNQGYFWTPGAWVRPPRVGVLWTPAYWGLAGTVFVFHPGYWGSTVGFYGGVNYGYGYFGNGYSGGHWIGNSFAYNTAVNHVNPAVAHHAYAEAVPHQGSRGVMSYSGGTPVGAAARTVSPHQSLSQAVKPATTATIERTAEHAPSPTEMDRPAAVVKTPPPSAPPKSNHVAPARSAAPVKQ